MGGETFPNGKSIAKYNKVSRNRELTVKTLFRMNQSWSSESSLMGRYNLNSARCFSQISRSGRSAGPDAAFCQAVHGQKRTCDRLAHITSEPNQTKTRPSAPACWIRAIAPRSRQTRKRGRSYEITSQASLVRNYRVSRQKDISR